MKYRILCSTFVKRIDGDGGQYLDFNQYANGVSEIKKVIKDVNNIKNTKILKIVKLYKDGYSVDITDKYIH